MPPAVAIPALGGAFAAAAAAKGAKRSLNHQREASRIEAGYTAEALRDAREERTYGRARDDEERGYTRGRYADETAYSRGKYAEERDFGRGEFANYLGRLDPYSKVGAAAVQGLGASLPSPTSLRPTMGSGMVKMQAPTGEVRDVPESEVQHFVSKGGKVVG